MSIWDSIFGLVFGRPGPRPRAQPRSTPAASPTPPAPATETRAPSAPPATESTAPAEPSQPAEESPPAPSPDTAAETPEQPAPSDAAPEPATPAPETAAPAPAPAPEVDAPAPAPPAPAPTPSGWRVAKSLLRLKAQIDAKHPGRSTVSDGTIGDAAHRSRTSDHNAWIEDEGVGVVSAMDITHDSEKCDAGVLVEKLVASRDPRIKYIIHNGRIISSKMQPWVWRPYNGANAHAHHFHISVMAEKEAYDDEGDWAV